MMSHSNQCIYFHCINGLNMYFITGKPVGFELNSMCKCTYVPASRGLKKISQRKIRSTRPELIWPLMSTDVNSTVEVVWTLS